MDNSIFVQIIFGALIVVIQGNMWYKLGKLSNELTHLKDEVAKLRERFDKQFEEVPKIARRK